MSEREWLEQAVAHLEAQRAVLGDAAVDAALTGLRQKLAGLHEPGPAPCEPGLSPSSGERKLVTILFADLSGFTALSEELDPEAVRDLVNRCFERLVPCIEKCGGVVARFIGDEIMALFGAPVTHENDAELAVRAALNMMTSLQVLSMEQGADLGLHCGINTGLVVAGEIGSRQKQEYSVMGDTVNVASRLADASERGQIFVGPDTYRLTRPLFEFEVLGSIKVKGKVEPVPVYRVLGPKAKPGSVRGLEAQGIRSPLVGREPEFATLKGCLERLLSGQGGIASVIGEAGVGKSRLMAEIRTAVTEGDGDLRWQWLEGRALSFGRTISYWPFQEILRSWAGITEEDREDEAWCKLEGQVRALFGGETMDILPYLASMLVLRVREGYAERIKYLDGEAMGKQIFLTSRRFFEQLAHTRPAVLVFEDLHWIDESSAALLEHLLPLVESVPLLIVGISRPEREVAGARLREIVARDYACCYSEIRLAPLSAADSTQLLRNLLEVENLPPRVSETLIGKAEGNPFFLEEVIRTLIGAGAVVRDPASGRWRATGKIDLVAIPDTIQGVIMARVDRLEEGVKHVLRVASVIGRSFLYRVLQAIAEAGQDLDGHLAELQQIELIREKQIIPELEYIFKHALAQEATYESILLQKRRELHGAVGQAIETLFADRLEGFYGLLAYHYARAEAWEKAHHYLLKAGDQAGSIAADAEALGYYDGAMAAYARAFGDRWDPVQRAILEGKMSEAFFRRGEFPQALEYAGRALGYLGYRLPASRWGVRRAIPRELALQRGHRLLPRLFLKDTTMPVDPAFEVGARLYVEVGLIDAFSNPERYFLVVLRLLNLSEQRGYPFGAAVGATGVGTAFDFLGLLGLAGRYHHRALSVAGQHQHPVAIGFATSQLCYHGLCAGELEEGLEHSLGVIKPHREIGELRNVAMAIWMTAYNYAHRGDLDRALGYGQDLARLGQDAADHEVRCWGELVQGYAERRRGHLEEAIAHQQTAIKLSDAIPDYLTRVPAGGELGLCYLRQGDWQAALAELERSQQLSVEHRMTEPYGVATVLNGLAEASLLAVEQSEASQRSAWMKKAQGACRNALRQARVFRVRLPKAMRLQGRYEWLVGKPAAAQKWWQRSLDTAERIGLRYDLGMTHMEMGSRLGDRAHLEQAVALFAEIGAEWSLDRARQALASL